MHCLRVAGRCTLTRGLKGGRAAEDWRWGRAPGCLGLPAASDAGNAPDPWRAIGRAGAATVGVGAALLMPNISPRDGTPGLGAGVPFPKGIMLLFRAVVLLSTAGLMEAVELMPKGAALLPGTDAALTPEASMLLPKGDVAPPPEVDSASVPKAEILPAPKDSVQGEAAGLSCWTF